MTMDPVHHYPPDLFQLLVDAIPRLVRSKRDVLLFFRGAGVPRELMGDLERTVAEAPDTVRKFEIVQTVLTRLNDGGDRYLGPRRVLLKRVQEFEDFSSCWENDRWQAEALVEKIRRAVNVKDSFTRMNQERERLDRSASDVKRKAAEDQAAKQHALEALRSTFFSLFGESNPHRRGKTLEAALNDLFKHFGVLIREAFTLRAPETGAQLDQIDGVISLDGHTYLVEMKWWDTPIGKTEIAPHLVNVYGRPGVGGIFISYSHFTDSAVQSCRDALSQRVVTLVVLEEIVAVLDQGADLIAFLREKIRSAAIDKNPFVELLGPLRSGHR